MTVGARIKTAFVSGTTLNNPLAIGDTSLSSASLSSLATITAPDYAAIVLDPGGVNGTPEVVWVTAHTAAATTATISRAAEGSTARAHPVGTSWVHGATIMDLAGQQGTDLASASTLTLPNSAEDYFNVTGTTTVTAISNRGAGKIVRLRFTGACPITHNGTSLILLNAASVTTVAGDILEFVCEGSGNWRQINVATLVSSRTVVGSGSSTTMTTGSTVYDASGGTITLAPGTWSILAFINFQPPTSLAGGIFAYIRDSSNNQVGYVIAFHSYISSASAQDFQLTQAAIVTITSTTTYKCSGTNTQNGGTLTSGQLVAVRIA